MIDPSMMLQLQSVTVVGLTSGGGCQVRRVGPGEGVWAARCDDLGTAVEVGDVGLSPVVTVEDGALQDDAATASRTRSTNR
jgi:hypothetical protein